MVRSVDINKIKIGLVVFLEELIRRAFALGDLVCIFSGVGVEITLNLHDLVWVGVLVGALPCIDAEEFYIIESSVLNQVGT